MATFEERLEEFDKKGESKFCDHCKAPLVRGKESDKRKESFGSFVARKFCDKECRTAARDANRLLDDGLTNYAGNCLRCNKKLVRKQVQANGYPESPANFQCRMYCDKECVKGERVRPDVIRP